jgi:ankyrin repeat protein
VRALLAHGVDPDSGSARGCTPLCVAATADVARALLAGGARINASLREGATPLLFHVQVRFFRLFSLCQFAVDRLQCAQNGRVEIVTLLLDAGASLDAALNSGEMALALAAQRGHRELVGLFINRKVDLDRPNANGATALFLAAQVRAFPSGCEFS